MKLRPLLLVVAVLAAVSVIAHFATRPTPPPSADPRIGQPLVEAAALERAAGLRLSEGDRSVELAKGADGAWRVTSYHDLPADFPKLSRFVNDLTGAKLERLVTRNPELIARLEFKDTRVTLLDADGRELWSVNLGKNADGGGRFVRFGTEDKAFLTRFNAWLDFEARNWADSTLVGLKSEDIARVEITFPDAPSIMATRNQASDTFAAADAPEDRTLRATTITSLLGTLTSLRFTDTTVLDDPDAVAARAHARTITLTTFDGTSVTVALGRHPETQKIKDPQTTASTGDPAAMLESLSDPAAGTPTDLLEPVTETVPAGPVFAFITHSSASAPINALMARHAAKVSDYAYTSLPATPDDLFEAAAAP